MEGGGRSERKVGREGEEGGGRILNTTFDRL